MKKQTLKNVAAWVLSVLLGLSFIMAGWTKIIPSESMITRFENWGYSETFAVIIGVLEFGAGVLVLIPRAAAYGALLLAVVMLGAIYTHVSTQIGSPLFAVIYLLMAILLGSLRIQEAFFLKS